MHVLPLSLTNADAAGAASREDQAAKRAASQFEALFLSKLATVSHPTDDEDGDIFRSDATDSFQQMFGEQLGTTMAEAGGIGLGDIILKQIHANRGDAPATAKTPSPLHSLREGDVALAAARTSVADATTAAPGIARRATLTPRATDVKDAGDLLELPVHGRVSSGFGSRRDPFTGRRRTHAGVDIAAAKGTPIQAAADGKVVFAGRRRGYGNTVVIEHSDGRRTRYAHAAKLTVSSGEKVNKGETIGLVGSTGRSTGPHVHFEVIDSGRHINPLRAVARDEAIARTLDHNDDVSAPTLARAAEAAGAIRSATPAVQTLGPSTGSLRASVTLPAGAVRTVSTSIVVPAGLARPRFESRPVSLSLPVHGRVSSDFGARRDPFTGRPRIHEGVDIAVPKGTPIRAAADGTVVFAGKQRGYGNTVIIEHADGRRTRYAHASKLGVTEGEGVSKGETIGLVGSTGRSTGPHLHFEVIEAGVHVNPLRAVAHDRWTESR